MNEATGLSSLFSLTLLAIFVFWLYPDYKIDLFRQKMFKKRDELFDEALNGNIEFNNPAYRMLRDTMNGFIRFAHRLSIWQVLLFSILMKIDAAKPLRPFDQEFNKNTQGCTDEQKALLKKYYTEMDTLILEHLILSSFPIHAFNYLLRALHLAKKQSRWLMEFLESDLDKLNTLALTEGKLLTNGQ